ncbi:MAG TPA: hypothetical protein DDZ67_08960 [Xanthomonadaceae bacterium]|nr:hypothetical protein [Xanthomonadaceae bacterium]
MELENLDDDELLGLSLEASTAARDADAVALLKVLVERNPRHAHGQYLLAAQHAQLGLLDRAEQGFRVAVELAPRFPMARFQLGQLLLAKGEVEQAASELRSVGSAEPALAAYAEGLCALAEGIPAEAVASLRRGLAAPQAIPALAEDMRRLLENLAADAGRPAEDVDMATNPMAAPMLLSNYNRYN